MTKQLNSQEYLQVLGLLTLAKHHMARIKDIEESLKEVFAVESADEACSGVGSPDHIGDAIYSDYSITELLGKLGVSPPDQSVATAMREELLQGHPVVQAIEQITS